MKTKTAGALILAIIVLSLSACYQINEQDSAGGLALKAAIPARGLSMDGAPDNEVWVVGFLIQESFEKELKDAISLEDGFYAGNESITRRDVADSWKTLADNGGVRFDGGKSYFQFSMSRVMESTTDSFKITGIPAGNSYFVYLMVFEDRIDSLEDLEDYPEATSALHFYDPDWFVEDPEIGLDPGWYFFTNWNLSYDGGYYSSGINPWYVDDELVRPGAFAIRPDETTVVNILLVDNSVALPVF